MHLTANIIRSTKKEDKTAGTRSALGTDTGRIKVWFGKYEKKNSLKDLGIDRTMVLKYI
jgi:hypothetical protein